MTRGFSERLIEEVERVKPYYEVKIIEKPYRRYISWMGASILASLSSFQSKWITKSEYEEMGNQIIYKKSMI